MAITIDYCLLERAIEFYALDPAASNKRIRETWEQVNEGGPLDYVIFMIRELAQEQFENDANPGEDLRQAGRTWLAANSCREQTGLQQEDHPPAPRTVERNPANRKRRG